nr:hypothetical protein MACL_00001817 [Theileria orientalis]
MLTSAKIVETSVIKVETRCQHSAIDKMTIPILDVDCHLHKHLKLNMNVNTDRHTLLLNCALIGGITCLAISYSVDDLRNERMSCSNFRFFLSFFFIYALDIAGFIWHFKFECPYGTWVYQLMAPLQPVAYMLLLMLTLGCLTDRPPTNILKTYLYIYVCVCMSFLARFHVQVPVFPRCVDECVCMCVGDGV